MFTYKIYIGIVCLLASSYWFSDYINGINFGIYFSIGFAIIGGFLIYLGLLDISNYIDKKGK